ncbi:MAG: YeeE/YedE family protein [bacterium]|nr:YeeE/YedE family protein [bacterium]
MLAPFALEIVLGKAGAIAIYLLIGFGFGFVLEMSGFGNSRKLAAQFYFKDMTVLKVMFTGIVVAMVLIFWTTGLKLLDFSQVWVNPTYLWPGVVGGLIMGVGFIIGGFCPGTSLVSASTLKIDGIFYLAGVLFGVFVFGETIDNFRGFWTSSDFGRLTLTDWMGLPTGIVVSLLVAMALFMFWGSEQLERIFGKRDLTRDPKLRIAGGGLLLLLALGLIPLGQPSIMDRYEMIASEKEPMIEQRQVQIHPGELLDLMYDDMVQLVMLDLREERDFNIFHLLGAERVDPANLAPLARELSTGPEVAVHVLMDNDESIVTDAWRELTARELHNVYILEGGLNNWLDLFGHEGHDLCTASISKERDGLNHEFQAALGSSHYPALPEHDALDLQFEARVKLEKKRAVKAGGCGG